MSFEAELPGRKLNLDAYQIICYRYYTASRLVPGKRVLEVGCGAGLGLGYLANKGAEQVVGGDYSIDNLMCAREYYGSRFEFIQLDAHALPFKDACFDVILLYEVIFYLAYPQLVIEECHRILSKEGILILCLPNKDVPGFRGSSLATNYCSVPELHALLTRYDFDAELYGVFPISEGATRRRIRSALMAWAGKVLDLVERVPQGRKVRGLLNQIILKKNITLGHELKDLDEDELQSIPLASIPYDSPDFRHRVLYSIAHAR